MSEPGTTATKGALLPRCKSAPGPQGHFLLGSTKDIQRYPLRFGLAMAQQYGDIVRIRFLFWRAYLVNHPEGVKHVLQENQRNYSKDIYPYKIFKPLLGQGLVTNNGDSWLQQRRLMQPAFHRKRLAALGTLMTGAAVAMLDRWQAAHPEVETVELVVDPQLDPMACVVETELGRIEVGLSAQLESIRTTLAAVAVEPVP